MEEQRAVCYGGHREKLGSDAADGEDEGWEFGMCFIFRGVISNESTAVK